ncbi:MAG: cation:proton antiporter [Parvibaculaceae bacterium]
MAAPDPMIYKQVLVVLVTAGVVIPLFHRLKLSPILGFLLMGILVGPSVLGRAAADLPWLSRFVVTDAEEIDQFADLGVVFLLFMIGLELSFQRLVSLRRLVFGLGSLQVVASILAIALMASLFLGATEAVLVGAALSLSSTAIVIELLSRQKRLSSQAGRTAFSVLLFQDLAVVPLLLLVGVLGRQENGLWWVGLLMALFQALVTIALVVVVGRYVLSPFLRLVAQTRSPDLFLAAVLLIVVGTALVTSLSGLSMALGAFLAGLVLAETEFRREIETLIEPFKGLLLGVFFLLVGMTMDIADVAAHPFEIMGFALLLVALKALIVLGAGRLFGIGWPALLETALLLGPGGEFAFVMLGASVGAGLVTTATAGTASVVVSLSMVALPLLSLAGRKLSQRVAVGREIPQEAMVAPAGDAHPKVIVAGFGRVGKLVCGLLKEHGIPYLAVDTDPMQVARCRREGWVVYYGDAARASFLRTCGAETAATLVVTVDQPSKVDEIVAVARTVNPELRVIVRARDETHAQHLYKAGASEAVPETIEASLQLAESVLVESGVAMGLAIASIHEHRDSYRKLLGRPDRRRLVEAQRRKAGEPAS